MTRKFIAQTGNYNNVKIFDASTGSLYKIINVGGQVMSPPIVIENELTVNVKSGAGQVTKMFSLPSGSLKNNIPVT
jgi:hypothetical protein